MIILLTIFQFFIQAVVDLMDKFLITTRKIEPVSYTFYTVVTGLLLLIIWPWAFAYLPIKFILLNLLSGAYFALAMYVFFVALSQGEASRVVPFIFGLVPVFDIWLSYFLGRGSLSVSGVAAMCLLIPGALLVSHQKGPFWGKHVSLKLLSAILFSSYYFLWQFGAQVGPVLNNLMWNRLGAGAVLILLLAVPIFRKKVLAVKKLKNKNSTSAWFLFKQVLGGLNFVFLSSLMAVGNIAIIDSLQGFRYVFLLILGLILGKKRKHILSEETAGHIFTQKTFGILLIFLGTVFLFI